ncbi:hypothetical protein FS837_007569, partial [Tulasnella sp. UAMH 9824]
NIVGGNIFTSSSAGPELYGTEPWYSYLSSWCFTSNLPSSCAPLTLSSAGHSLRGVQEAWSAPMGHGQRKFPASVADDTAGTLLLGYFVDSLK